MDYVIRELKQREVKILDTFLYEAIFIPEGMEAPPKDILKHPDLQIYISDFGKKTDVCYVAEIEKSGGEPRRFPPTRPHQQACFSPGLPLRLRAPRLS